MIEQEQLWDPPESEEQQELRCKPSQRQALALTLIERSLRERGYPPTLREIGNAMGIGSTNGVNDHLRALERKGYIVRSGSKSRAIQLVDSGVKPGTQPPPVVTGWRFLLIDPPHHGTLIVARALHRPTFLGAVGEYEGNWYVLAVASLEAVKALHNAGYTEWRAVRDS